MTYTNSFTSNSILGVKFDIFCGMTSENEFSAVITKTPCTPAKATIKIEVIDTDIYKQKCVDGWINRCILKFNFNPRVREDFGRATFPFEFKCTITWHGFKESIPGGIYANLKNFLTSPDLSDMTIVIGKKQIPVHKAILAAYSPVFFAMFKANMRESVNKQIVVTDIEVDIMEKAINFMYTGVIHPVPEICDLLSIMQVADKYRIIALMTWCERKLIERLEVENVLEILDKASEYAVPQLMKIATSFMVENKSAIVKLEKLADVHRRKPEVLLEFIVRSMAAD
ncbi:hypothetical protein PV325_007820 [Microctonus aethiopoides]|nr:hypothetical protein PV325_007820 [Microctonus aethiopoides]